MSEYLCLPRDFRPEHGWHYGGLEGFADCGPYLDGIFDDIHDFRWCEFSRLAPGDAAIYPVKLVIPERGIGQFRYEEIQAWRYNRWVLEALFHHHIDGEPVPLPPGINAGWLAEELGAL